MEDTKALQRLDYFLPPRVELRDLLVSRWVVKQGFSMASVLALEAWCVTRRSEVSSFHIEDEGTTAQPRTLLLCSKSDSRYE